MQHALLQACNSLVVVANEDSMHLHVWLCRRNIVREAKPTNLPEYDFRDLPHHTEVMPKFDDFSPTRWPVLRQAMNGDVFGLGESAASDRTETLAARTAKADKVVGSVCPYCAVGCGQLIYVKDEKIIDIEGDPGSPVSNGCLCPKRAATFQLVTGSHRVTDVLYRRPHGKEWEKIPLDRAIDMVAARMKKARDEHWEDKDKDGNPLRRTMSMAHLGGATLDNEENYLIKKLFTALGIVQIENQARI